ncbi:MAG TPA: methylmalonyl-CoA mutase family protein [Xanthobacteraceae bacterium]|nr:methylmalonyl-CoA mutase family protein [Xanthobacteraceae bacterium]
MTDPEKTLPLAADSAPATREDWRKLVDAVLKGAPFERLVSTTYDGLRIEPLAGRRPGARPLFVRPGAAPWQALARIDQPDPALANEAALDELKNGATGLSLVFGGAVGDYGFALPASDAALGRALEGIDLGAGLPLELDLSPQAEAMIDAALARGQARSLRGTNVRLGHDPLGAMAISGGAARRWSEEAPHFGRRLAALAREGFSGRLAVADGRVIHNAGGSEAQELAFALAVALAYLRALETAGVVLETARRMLFFRLAADADQFLTMAKFRALRKLWARVEASCGLAAEPAFVSAETAWRMMGGRDAQVNILRGTIAVFAAALGGADAISVLPFTAARALPDRFARRVARNAQLILIGEAHLAKVADPAAGSGAVEDLTDELCGAAWRLFRDIEAAGGIAAALENGVIQQKVDAVRAERAAAVARRQDALIGVSVFPNLHEAEVGRSSDVRPRGGQHTTFVPLPPIRLAEPFEALRDISDRVLAETDARPKIFLASLGMPADFTARVTFAKNFFEAGGIEAVANEDGYLTSPPASGDISAASGGEASTAWKTDLAALVCAFKASGLALVCLCSSDKVYEREAAAAAEALKAAGARHIYLAGRPGDRAAPLRIAGVQSFIYEGCDALATLKAAYDILGIEIG